LKKGEVLASTGKTSSVKDVYSALIKTYPYSVEAKTAQERLRSLLNEPKP
jgi:TolA-binding protein